MYDARMRDWYIKAAASPKVTIILQQISNLIEQSNSRVSRRDRGIVWMKREIKFVILPKFTEEVLNLLIRTKHLFMLSDFPRFAKWIKLVSYSNCKNQILTE